LITSTQPQLTTLAGSFSPASTTPVWSDVYNSEEGIGVGSMPMFLNMSMYTGLCMLRILSPLASSIFSIGRLVLKMLRTPGRM